MGVMNKLRSLVFVPLRGYRKSRRSKSASSFSKSQLTETKLYENADIDDVDEDDFDDVEKLEADFTGANQTYRQFQKEQYIEKQKLKIRIIRRKYFKSDDPSFLTWAERREIQFLHEKDSKEWSLEVLSESFPALPDTIKRVLRAKWLPRNENVVLKYDAKVIENWERFKTGSIPVSSELAAHLEKFKHRQIKMADLKTIAEKFVKPKPVFPEPKTTIFTSLVAGYLEQQKAKVPMIEESTEKNELDIRPRNAKFANKFMNFENFVEQTINKKVMPQKKQLEIQLLTEEYRNIKEQRINSTQVDSENEAETVEKSKISAKSSNKKPVLMSANLQYTAKSQSYGDFDDSEHVEKFEQLDSSRDLEELDDVLEECSDTTLDKQRENENYVMTSRMPSKILTEKDFKEKFSSEIEQRSQGQNAVGPVTEAGVKPIYVDVPNVNLEKDKMATGIIEWKKLEVTGSVDYPYFIKIPKDKSRNKKTIFKVEDRYYDCDGSFLYRVPGLKT